MKTAFWMLFSASLLVLLTAVAYCWQNESGHSGEDPLIALMIFTPVFVIGLVGRLITKGRWLSARAVEVVGFVGMAFGFFVSKLGILVQYEDWIAAGMPNRNPNASLLLIGFVLGGLGGSLVVACLVTPKAEQVADPNRSSEPALKSTSSVRGSENNLTSGNKTMIEYLVKPTESDWFAFPEGSTPYRTIRTPFTAIDGWGNGRIEVEGCEISFSCEDPGIQVSFKGAMSQARADEIIEEIRQAIEVAGNEPAEVVQIS